MKMKIKIYTIVLFLLIPFFGISQTTPSINQTDNTGKKTGYWIKKEGNIKIYEGFFKDGHPVGEFKRFNRDNTLRSLLVFSDDGRTADATFYHPNGYIASKGRYVNQQKEGTWKFYSGQKEGYLICQEGYSKNMKNGSSVKYYPGDVIAEKMYYVNDIKNGEWTQFHPNGAMSLKSYYLSDKINGKFDVWYETGKKEVTGEYKNDKKEGRWLIYKEDGTLRYELDYVAGFTNDRRMQIDESDFLDSLEKNMNKIPDPEETGVLW